MPSENLKPISIKLKMLYKVNACNEFYTIEHIV